MWMAEFALYTHDDAAGFDYIQKSQFRVASFGVPEAVEKSLTWLRENRHLTTPDTYFSVRVQGDIYFDAATRFIL